MRSLRARRVLGALAAIAFTAGPVGPALAQEAEPPPEFRVRNADDPRSVFGNPEYDSRFDPQSPFFEPGYDPAADADHPLKGGKPPGGGWNDVTPKAEADWPWGELFYDGVYPTRLVTTNRCPTPETIVIVASDLPFLTIPETMTVPPGVTTIPATITAPPTPPPPIRLGLPDEPGYGWVEPPGYDPKTGQVHWPPQNPPYDFHQPHFGTAEGTIQIWHAWNPPCAPSLETYTVAGHFHFRPPTPGGDGGPSQIAAADPCLVYWNLGEPPPGFDGRDCTDAFRGYARDYVARTLDYAIRSDPDRWRWLPSAAEVGSMDATALVAMKARAEALLADAGLPPPAAVADLCVASWVDGAAPEGLDPAACTTHFRAFAVGEVTSARGPEGDEAAVRALPSNAEIRSMTAEQLLAIQEKLRAARRGTGR